MIKKYKQYVNENKSDIDPWNEEDWEDNNFKKGDKVVALKNINHINFSYTKGRTYEIKYVVNSIDMYSLSSDKFDSVFTKDELIKLFVKKIQENKTDIDPWNEEDWEDNIEFKVGDKIKYVENNVNGVIKSIKTRNGWVDDPDDEPITICKIEWNKDEIPRLKWGTPQWIETEWKKEDLEDKIKKKIFKKG